MDEDARAVKPAPSPGGPRLGHWGRILWADLSRGETHPEELPETVYRQFLGGYGLAARVIAERQKAGVDPLGPEAILAVAPGLLTGTGAIFSGRFMIAGKSPLTGGWGDANCGGHFGPALRNCGYDAAFVTGRSPKPVYLVIDGERGAVEIRPAADLWGKDVPDTEEALRQTHGHELRRLGLGFMIG